MIRGGGFSYSEMHKMQVLWEISARAYTSRPFALEWDIVDWILSSS